MINGMIENYLGFCVSCHQEEWDDFLPGAEFEYNSAMTEYLGMSLLEIDMDCNPKSSFHVVFGAEISAECIEAFSKSLKRSIEDTQYSYMISKARQSAQSSKHV